MINFGEKGRRIKSIKLSKYPRHKIKILDDVGEMRAESQLYKRSVIVNRGLEFSNSYYKKFFKLQDLYVGKNVEDLIDKFKELTKSSKLKVEWITGNGVIQSILHRVNLSLAVEPKTRESHWYYYFVDDEGVFQTYHPVTPKNRVSNPRTKPVNLNIQELLGKVVKEYIKRGKPILLGNFDHLINVFGRSYSYHQRGLTYEDVFPIYVVNFKDYFWGYRNPKRNNYHIVNFNLLTSMGDGFNYDKLEKRFVFSSGYLSTKYIFITPKKYVEQWRLRKI